MRKILTVTLSILILGSISYGQTTSEILQLAQNNALGTARFNGLSGAFGALGGDLTALTVNPAGSAVFQNSYGSITLGQSGTTNRSNYFGSSASERRSFLDFNQIGAVLILKNNAEKGPSKIALGLSYNKTNDFRNNIRISGRTPNSISNYFAGLANGTNVNNFVINSQSELQQAYIDIGNNLGFSAQQGFLGFQGFLISDTSPTTFSPEITGGDISQQINIETGGSSGKITINVGAEFEKTLYVGANVNFHNVNFDRTIVLNESNFSGSNDIDGAVLVNRLETNGTGVSVDFGAIAKINDYLRLGLSYQSPTFHELQDSYSQQLETFFTDNTSQFIDPNVIILLPEYQFRTPGTLSGSVAVVAGKNGLISAQYSRKDFSNTRFTTSGIAFDELNTTIENTFTAVNTFRIGGEYRFENWRLRGGLSKITSPYQDSRIAGDTNGFSLGVGYNWGKWKFDTAFNRTVSEQREALFESESFTNAANINRRNSAVTMTLGVNF